MVYWRLSKFHKKRYIQNQIILFISMAIMAIIALQVESLQLPTNASKLSASAGFMMVAMVFGLAFFNRVGNLFKIRSVGFIVLFMLFLFLDTIIGPLKVATGLMIIPLLIDDMIMKPIWLNIWYRDYEK